MIEARPISGLRRRLFALAKRAMDRQQASGPRIPGLAKLLWIFYRIVKPEGIRRITVRGVDLCVDGHDEIIYPALVAYGTHDPEEYDLIMSLVRPGMTVLDIGANIGIYTVLCARLVGPEGRVYAFEPEPGTYALLSTNLEANHVSNTVAVAAALSDREGTATLYRDRWNAGGHTLLEDNITTQSQGSVQIETHTMDGYFGGKDVVADFIKMDAQGFEGHVVRGGKEFLQRGTPTLLMEFWPEGLCNAGTDPERLLRELSDLGYRLVSPEGAEDPRDSGEVAREAAGGSGKDFVNLLLKRATRS